MAPVRGCSPTLPIPISDNLPAAAFFRPYSFEPTCLLELSELPFNPFGRDADLFGQLIRTDGWVGCDQREDLFPRFFPGCSPGLFTVSPADDRLEPIRSRQTPAPADPLWCRSCPASPCPSARCNGEIHRLGEERGRATRRDVASCRISSAASAYRPWREQQRCQGEAPSVVVVVRPSGIMASLSPIILQSISNNEFKILMHGRPLCHSRQYIWNLISNRCQSLLQFKFPIPICNSRV